MVFYVCGNSDSDGWGVRGMVVQPTKGKEQLVEQVGGVAEWGQHVAV